MELRIVEKSSYGGGGVECDEREQSVKGRRRRRRDL